MKQNYSKLNNQSGFTLIEAVLSVVILIFLVAAVVRITQFVSSSNAAVSESGETVASGGQLINLISNDFEKLGWNMSKDPLENINGESFAGILQNPDFTTLGNGNYKRIANNANKPAVLSYVIPNESPATISFTPQESVVFGFRNTVEPAQNSYVLITGESAPVNVYENGQIPPYNQMPQYNFQRGDVIEIKRESLVINQKKTCSVSYYYKRNDVLNLFYRSSSACPDYQAEIYFDVAKDESISDVKISASKLVPHSQLPITPKMALLPNYETLKPASPFFYDTQNDQYIFLSGDDESDASVLQNTVSFSSTASSVSLTIPTLLRGTINKSDKLLLVDYETNTSLVVNVEGITNPSVNEISLLVSAINNINIAAWGKLWTDTTNRPLITFPSGARVIKLAPPVQWKFDNAYKALFRKQGDAWSIAGEGITSIGVNTLTDQNRLGFETVFTLRNDGRETGYMNKGFAVKKVFYPRFLNRMVNTNF